ncbi:hypothetical protein EXU48_02530 [Occultella glacieicola]|uniref:Uncharacterized protein n=1 Tax=Occultella glacieicola TaxID=2518684 RepID=A0ABY2E985_9MICO|nr:hypothetical protein [Occultella glacieicola]TDE99075.1 hypothetical protein EXU48_02530 [Occultella glacieicola]
MSTPPTRTSLRGPVILTAAGALVLVAAIVVAVLVVRLFLSVLPVGLVGADGVPGPEAVGGTDVPGTLTLELEADTTYTILLAHPSNAQAVALGDAITVTGPDGRPATSTIGPSTTVDNNGVSARSIDVFTTAAAGAYAIVVPPLDNPAATAWATVVVAEGDELPGFIGGIFGTIFGVFLALGLGVAGVAMIVGGAVWWHIHSRARRSFGAGGGPGGYPGQYPQPGQYPPNGQYPPPGR